MTVTWVLILILNLTDNKASITPVHGFGTDIQCRNAGDAVRAAAPKSRWDGKTPLLTYVCAIQAPSADVSKLDPEKRKP
jgi:hypothetical protein